MGTLRRYLQVLNLNNRHATYLHFKFRSDLLLRPSSSTRVKFFYTPNWHGYIFFTRLQLKLSRVNFFTHQIELCEFISAGYKIIPESIFLHTKLTRSKFIWAMSKIIPVSIWCFNNKTCAQVEFQTGSVFLELCCYLK